MSLAAFNPLIARWFSERVGRPTEIQELAWPRISGGEHVLVTAPTGSGKTLTAFLWSLNQLLAGTWSGRGVQVLYVSPLRALNNDIRRNLISPLAELEQRFADEGSPLQQVRVVTRSGDTPSAERQRMIRNPPEILITTPESLNILLTSKGGRSILGSLRCVILDEIHAAAGSKRGTHLMTAVERLTLLSGEFQRIALSATVRPAEKIARFVGGQELIAAPAEGAATYRRRTVEVVTSKVAKRYLIEVDSKLTHEEAGPQLRAPLSVWEPLVADLRQRIRGNRSTLLFANSRRVTEKVTRLLNEDQEYDLAYSHHGSLSREIRSVVEKRLKEGRLAAIVSTSSLELGIDIGALDEVILLRTPPSVSAAVQRLGRAGHGVGEVSRGRFYPLFENDLLEAVAVARGVEEQDIEEIQPISAPLDVLAQVVISMVAAEPWRVEELYRFVRTAYAYRNLTRRQFDLVLEMLAGRYSDSRIRELRPRVAVDRIDGTVRARPGAARLIYSSGGTIPDRGYFHLRLAENKAKLGELDEEFVWERSIGDTFTLGAQSWQITGITHNDVLVRPAHRGSAMAPFWRAEERNRSFHLSERIGLLLARAEEALRTDGSGERLRQQLESEGLAAKASEDLVRYLVEQREATGQPLPHRHHILIENLPSQEGEAVGQRRVIVHTRWGGQVNRPLALAIAAAWEKDSGEPLQIEQDNECLMLSMPAGDDPMRILRLVHPDNVERLLRERLEQSGFFGARFRESAGRALLLPRGDFRRRVPLWFNRQRAKKLLQSIQRYEDFPVLVETWRTCLQDEFDLENLARVLAELDSGIITSSETTTSGPSPFAADIVWKTTNRLMYEDDEPEDGGRSPLRHDLLRELVFGSQLRPRLPETLVDNFQRKLHRTYPGYAPQSSDDLIDWVRERVVMPQSEWQELVAAIDRDLALDPVELAAMLEEADTRLVRGTLSGSYEPFVVAHVEQVPRLVRDLGFSVNEESPAIPQATGEQEVDPDPQVALVAEWMRFYGPFEKSVLSALLGLEDTRVESVLETLVEEEIVVIDHFRQGLKESDELEICDTENLERLLRLLRAESRPTFEARRLETLPLFLSHHQGLGLKGGDSKGLMAALEKLFGYPAQVGRWESEILPARLDPYYTNWLDGLFQDTDLVWLGCGREQVSFLLRSDLDLLQEEPDSSQDPAPSLFDIFPSQPGRYSLAELEARSGVSPAELSSRLWTHAWQGEVSNTTFQTLRRGTLNRFQSQEMKSIEDAQPRATSRRRGLSRRGRFERWRAGRPDEGDWWVAASGAGEMSEPLDALDQEELNKDRVRLLMQRYGILFRELLTRELPALQWSRLFRTLRLMDLSGEILSGRFFTGIPGLQFISPPAFRELRDGISEDLIYWMNAIDPASPCGLGLEDLKGELPARRPSSHLVYHGSRLVVISQRNGAELEIRVPFDHPKLDDYLEFLGVLLTRQFSPKRAVTVETINGEPAAGSPYGSVLEERFQASREPAGIKLRRRF